MHCSEMIALPFTAGDVYNSPSGHSYHDGSISTIVVVTSVLAFMTVLICLQTITTSGHVVLSPMILRLFLIFLVGTGFLCTLILGKQAYTQRLQSAQKKQSTCFRRLRLCFLWLFGIGVLVICTLELTYLSVCSPEISQFVPRLELHVDIGYHASRIVFVATEIIFISLFSHFKFMHSLQTYYAMLFIISANTSVWMYYYFALDILSAENLIKLFNVTSQLNITSQECLQNSTIAKFANKIEHILFPANTEFSLLGLKFVLEMWSLGKAKNKPRNSSISVMGIDADEWQSPNPNEEFVNASSIESDGEKSRLLDSIWEYKLHNSQNNSHTSAGRRRPFCLYLVIFISVALFVPLLVLYIILDSENQKSVEFYQHIATYEATYKAVMLLVISISWICLQIDGKPVKDRQSLNTKDLILLLCTFGSAVYFISVVIASLLTSSTIGSVTLTQNLISIVFLYLQTTLLLQSRRYVRKRRNTGKISNFRLTCVALAILNFGLWTSDNFIGMHFYAAWNTNVEVLGTVYWTRVLRYVFPFVVFYRLETAFSFCRIYGYFY